MTATTSVLGPVTSPAGPGPIPLRCHRVASHRHQRHLPVVAISWRVVVVPTGRTLGWVQLAYVRATGRVVWAAAAPYGGWVPIRSAGRRRGRDAVTALLIHHGLQEVR